VPFALGKDLYESAGSPKEFLEIKGGHNDGFYQSEQLIKERLAVFLKSL